MGEVLAAMGQCILLCLLPTPDHQPDMREEQRVSRKGAGVCVWVCGCVWVCVCVCDATCVKAF